MSEKFKFTMIAFDGLIARQNPDLRKVQGWVSWEPGSQDYPKDGPKNNRIEIINYDEISGKELDDLVFVPASKSGKTYSVYDVDSTNMHQRHRESLFGTILRTIDLFEEKDALGRRISWQFGDFPLKVFPYGATNRGAEYSRYDQWLKFSYKRSKKNPDDVIYTCASPDIIAHETAHAVLDAIAPELHGSVLSLEPHTAALHEAIADLTTVFLTLTMKEVREKVLNFTKGDLRQPCNIGWVAEEYGDAFSRAGINQYLRNLWSDNSLNLNWGNLVDEINDTYNLSLVFSGAIYRAMIDEYFQIWEDLCTPQIGDPFSLTGKALFVASQKIRRMLFRALDYLPPSNMVTFLDLARAILVADEAAYPRAIDSRVRKNMTKIFLDRGIAKSEGDLKSTPITNRMLFSNIDLNRFRENRAELDQFVDAHRSDLGLPLKQYLNSQIQLRSKYIYLPNNKSHYVQEYVIKISWSKRVKLSGIRRIQQVSGISIAVDAGSNQIKHMFSTIRNAGEGGFLKNRERVMDRYLNGLIARYNLNDVSGLTKNERNELGSPHYTIDATGQIHIHGLHVGLHDKAKGSISGSRGASF